MLPPTCFDRSGSTPKRWTARRWDCAGRKPPSAMSCSCDGDAFKAPTHPCPGVVRLSCAPPGTNAARPHQTAGNRRPTQRPECKCKILRALHGTGRAHPHPGSSPPRGESSETPRGCIPAAHYSRHPTAGRGVCVRRWGSGDGGEVGQVALCGEDRRVRSGGDAASVRACRGGGDAGKRPATPSRPVLGMGVCARQRALPFRNPLGPIRRAAGHRTRHPVRSGLRHLRAAGTESPAAIPRYRNRRPWSGGSNPRARPWPPRGACPRPRAAAPSPFRAFD